MPKHANDLIRKIQDLRHLDWNDISRSSATPGCFLKTYSGDGQRRIYYKLSNYDSYRGIFGHESINELIVSRLLDVLGVDHLSYRLLHALVRIDGVEHTTWLCTSKNFRKTNESKMALDFYYDLMSEPGESPLDFCVRMGWADIIYPMMLVDFLVANRDRHGANMEVLRSTDGSIRLSPLFDHGISLIFSCYDDVSAVENFDVLRDMPVNNWLGSRSLVYNLNLLAQDLKIDLLHESDFDYILGGLEDALPAAHLAKIREMIWKRWNYFEEVRNRPR